MADPDLALTREQFDRRYRVVRTLGAGGMASVTLAVQIGLDRPVAIKRLTLTGSGEHEALARFRAEARLHSRLDHPNLVRVYDYGILETEPFLVLEYVEGTTLADGLSDGIVDTDTGVAAVVEVLKALEYLHARGVLHRDVKPANVLLATGGAVKLADLGVALGPGRSIATADGFVMGTPAYMSPEQLAGEAPGPRSDLYAAGVVLHEICTGRLPRGVDCDTGAFLLERLSRSARPVAEAAPGLDPELADLVDRLLQRSPSSRPASARAVRRRLEPLRDRRPGRARERPGRAVRVVPSVAPRARVPAAIAAALVAAVVLVAALSPVPGAGRVPAPSSLVPSRLALDRTADSVTASWVTSVPVSSHLVVTLGSAARRVYQARRETPAARGELTVHGLDPFEAASVHLTLTGPGPAFARTAVLASPAGMIRHFCSRLEEDALTRDVPRKLARRELAPADLPAHVRHSLDTAGWPQVLALSPAAPSVLYPGTGPASIRKDVRADMLRTLVKLRRLERLGLMVGHPVDTGLAGFLGPSHAHPAAPLAHPVRLTAAVPPGAVLAFPDVSDSLLSPGSTPGVHHVVLTPPGRTRFREGRVIVEAERLPADVPVRVKHRESGLILELWAPPDRTGRITTIHALDPGFLARGPNHFELSLGRIEGQVDATLDRISGASGPSAVARLLGFEVQLQPGP